MDQPQQIVWPGLGFPAGTTSFNWVVAPMWCQVPAANDSKA